MHRGKAGQNSPPPFIHTAATPPPCALFSLSLECTPRRNETMDLGLMSLGAHPALFQLKKKKELKLLKKPKRVFITS